MDDLVRGSQGIAGPGIGSAWRHSRFSAPYLRNALWDAGYAVDTLETATDWTALPGLAAELGRTLRHGLEAVGERVHAFSHLSHGYPSGSSLYTTYIFRLATDPDETLERWRTLKTAASRVIVEHGATISHQHGIGTDHAPYLPAEKGPLGMEAIDAADPDLRPGRADGARRPPRGRAAVTEQILAVDVGTQSVRALVFDAAGVLVAGARIPIEPYVSPQPGWAEQDAELYWRTLGDACRQVLADPAVRRDAIAGMAVTTQRSTVVVTDEAGRRSGRRSSGSTSAGRPACRSSAGRRGSRSGRSACARRSVASWPTARRTGCAPTSPRPGARSATTCCCRAS